MIEVPVTILGASGIVGQCLLEALSCHPYFRVRYLAASEKNRGKPFGHVWHGKQLSSELASQAMLGLCDSFDTEIIFSALPSHVAKETEAQLVDRGHLVISNARAHRFSTEAALVIPEVNPEDAEGKRLITNPNCVVAGLALALKPLQDAFGIAAASVVTMQAVSGAGMRGLSAYSIMDNVITDIPGEEEKIARETKKVLGLDCPISVQCNRVPIFSGHTACVSLKLCREVTVETFCACLDAFPSADLPSAPEKPIQLMEDPPEPRFCHPMSVAVGRVRPCHVLDICFVLTVDNRMRGAAGAALLNGELLTRQPSQFL